MSVLTAPAPVHESEGTDSTSQWSADAAAVRAKFEEHAALLRQLDARLDTVRERLATAA